MPDAEIEIDGITFQGFDLEGNSLFSWPPDEATRVRLQEAAEVIKNVEEQTGVRFHSDVNLLAGEDMGGGA